ncbi:TPA: EpsG family protein [Vibrio diabolicus]|nr:EpsG family protein [Vibrio alginolyticus]
MKNIDLKLAFFFFGVAASVSYYSYFLALSLSILILPLVIRDPTKLLIAIFYIVSLSYLQSDFYAESDSLVYLDYFKSYYFGNAEVREGTKALELSWASYIYLLSNVVSPENFFFANSLVLYSFLIILLFKLERNACLLIFLAACFIGFSNNLNFLIRQYYASLVFLFGLAFFSKSKFKKSIVYFLSFGFHTSTIIYLPLLSNRVVKFLNEKAYHLLVFSIILSYIISLDLVIWFYNYFDGSGLVERLRYYSNIDSSSSVFSIYFLEKLFILLLILSVKIDRLSYVDKAMRALLVMSMCLYLMFSQIDILAERLGLFASFFIGFFLFIPMKYSNDVYLFRFKFNPIVFIYFYLPLRVVLWGWQNENTHIIRYFDGSIMSIGIFN